MTGAISCHVTTAFHVPREDCAAVKRATGGSGKKNDSLDQQRLVFSLSASQLFTFNLILSPRKKTKSVGVSGRLERALLERSGSGRALCQRNERP